LQVRLRSVGENDDPRTVGTLEHFGVREMHRSRINGLLIDCKTDDIDLAARFWAEALGRPVDPNHPSTSGNYRSLVTLPGELSIQIQRVDHESRMHIDIETDNIAAEVTRLEKLGAKVDTRMDRWVVMRAPTGQRFCVVRVQRAGFSENAMKWK
jgi:hypothetical protein